jgi:hypothetical protein
MAADFRAVKVARGPAASEHEAAEYARRFQGIHSFDARFSGFTDFENVRLIYRIRGKVNQPCVVPDMFVQTIIDGLNKNNFRIADEGANINASVNQFQTMVDEPGIVEGVKVFEQFSA